MTPPPPSTHKTSKPKSFLLISELTSDLTLQGVWHMNHLDAEGRTSQTRRSRDED